MLGHQVLRLRGVDTSSPPPRQPIDNEVVYHVIGVANANSSPLLGRCDPRRCGRALPALCTASMGTEPDGDAIFAERSSMPAGVGGDTEDAGDVDVECDASGVSGVPGDVGGVR